MNTIGLNVKERGAAVATFRSIDVRVMEMLAAWVPTTPEMEVKLLFGAHIWDVAQHADAFGKRTAELRLAEQYSLEPCGDYVALLEDIAAVRETEHRVAAFYDVVLPALERRGREYMDSVDPLLDAPTVRILERHFSDFARMTAESREVRAEILGARTVDSAWTTELQQREASITEIVVHRSAAPATSSGA
jgi:hypothetical protein